MTLGEDEGEQIEVVELDIDEAIAQIGTGIVGAKTIMLLKWAVLRGPFAGPPAVGGRP